jgi:nucleoside-diphosphate-sugar epimerase
MKQEIHLNGRKVVIMKIFVTGGTGFIGTHLIRRLKETQYELYCLARVTSQVEKLEEAGAIVIRGDVTDKQSLLSRMRGCEWVVNLANFYEFWTPKRRIYHDVNINGTRNVMEAAIETGISKIVHVSTAAVYGNAEWPVTEASEMGTKCFTEYAQTKRAGDLIAWELYEKEKLPLVVIYPGAVLGPDDPKAAGRYIRNVIRGKMPAQVLTGSTFPFVHVRDVAEAIVKALEKEDNIGEKYMIVSENMTFGDINRTLSDISGTKLPKLVLPDSLTILGAHLLTGLANLVKKPPILDMSVDQMRLMKHGLQVDGSKATRELPKRVIRPPTRKCMIF